MDYLYTNEKLGDGLRTLATHPGNVKSRLRIAYGNLAGISKHSFPREFQKKWEHIETELTKKGTIDKTLWMMRFKRASQIARAIYALRIEFGDYIKRQ